MSQTNQAVQVTTLPEMKKPTVPKVAYGEGRTWLHFPALVYMIVLTQIPFVLAVWFSLHSWNLLVPSEGFPFVGLSNYATEFVRDPNFWPIMGNTLQLVAGAIILALIAGTILALMLNRPIWGRSALRGIATVPFLVTPSVMSIIFIVAWEWTPFVMLVILAGLQSVPGEVLEAAKVDGANAFATFWRVVFPLLRKPYEIAILFGTIFIFQTFGEIYVTTAGGPGLTTNTLPYYTYRTALSSFQIGQAATLGVIGVIVAIFAARGMLQLMKERTVSERG